jgi:hypothetical protein
VVNDARSLLVEKTLLMMSAYAEPELGGAMGRNYERHLK